MNIFQKVTASVISLTFLTSGSVQARINNDHKVLWNTLEDVGVAVLLNEPDICAPENEVAGIYSPSHNVLVVCQDNRLPLTSREVEWTENDYDTLRHEAHHALQDCVTGIENSDMEKFYGTLDHGNIVRDTLTQAQINGIVEVYEKNGTSRESIVRELEAFAVAYSVSPQRISEVLSRTCTK